MKRFLWFVKWLVVALIAAYINIFGIKFLIQKRESIEGTLKAEVDVEYVYDGDTFYVVLPKELQISGTRKTKKGKDIIRVKGLDAPELKEAKCEEERTRAEEARDRLRDLVKKGEGRVELRMCEKDKYKRQACYVRVNGKDVAEILIDEGLGRKYGGEKRQGWCN